MTNDETLDTKLKNLMRVAEERRAAEEQRLAEERQRNERELKRLNAEMENATAIKAIVKRIERVLQSVSQYRGDDHRKMLSNLEAIMKLVQVIAVRVGGREIHDVLSQMEGAEKVRIITGDNATIGTIADGNATVDNIVNSVSFDDLPEAEKKINSLPEDIANVAVAAMQGPLQAAGVIATKVANKWRLTRQ